MRNFKLIILRHFVKIKFHRWWYRGNWGKLQAKKWKKKQHELIRSEFYEGLSKNSIPFDEYPVADKNMFMENFNAINTVGIELEDAFRVASEAESTRDFSPAIKGITVGLSTGTSGNRGVFLASEDERAHWAAAVLDRVLGFSFRKRSIAFFLRANSNLYSSVQSKFLQFEFFDLLAGLEEHIDRLNSLQPTFLIAQPSMLLQLADKQEQGILMIHPEKIISVAEVLYEEDRVYLEAIFNQVIHQVYQCTEGFLASTCEYGTLHFHEDLFIIEKKYIDKEKTRFHPVITDLERKSQPVIRYELNDIIREKQRCKCGSEWLAIEAIEGRSDDILQFVNGSIEKKLIFPDFFRRAIIMASSEIRDYALIQKSEKELELYINGSAESFTKAAASISDLLSQNGIEGVNIKQIFSNKTEKGAKLRRVKNEKKTTP